MLFLGSENHYECSKENFLEKKQKSKNKMLGVFDNKFCELLQKELGFYHQNCRRRYILTVRHSGSRKSYFSPLYSQMKG